MVVLIDSVEASRMERNWSLANVHDVHDIQHPCRLHLQSCLWIIGTRIFIILYDKLRVVTEF
ncbi:NADPH--cytochrome P450 reductase-like [Iris pallida]|uniref:NADPH--cytochrome P450 reductase-like n=1 Tax=Iris pallida TaxID=29817 RepID=A0AAX6G7D4_IRIPA|nr:NADPH--cytochrome P450 reductase-like [Iris pallida]KAJ6824522.1 NADPH--cytochrome P450 reductase-like [Iris pallida]